MNATGGLTEGNASCAAPTATPTREPLAKVMEKALIEALRLTQWIPGCAAYPLIRFNVLIGWAILPANIVGGMVYNGVFVHDLARGHVNRNRWLLGKRAS